MKWGFMFFTYLERVIVITRISIIPLIIAVFLVPWNSNQTNAMIQGNSGDMLMIVLGLLILAVVISLITLPIHAPNSAKMARFIAKYELDFEDRLKEQFAKKRQVKIQLLKGYSYGNGLRLMRKVEGYEVLPYLVLVAVVSTTDGTWFVSETKSLMSTKPCERVDFYVEDAARFDLQEAPHNSNRWFKQLYIRYGESAVEIFAKDDYHYRGLIDVIKALPQKAE